MMTGLDSGFIFHIRLLDYGENGIVDMALLLLIEIFYVDRPAVFNDNMCFFNPGQMSFPYLVGVVDADGDDGTAGLFGDFKAAGMKGQEGIRLFAAAPFRENTDGDAGFHFFHSFQNCFHTLLNVLPVQKKAVQIFHPVGEERYFEHTDFCDVTGGPGHPYIGHDDIEITPMVADIEYRLIQRNIFFADCRDRYAGEKEDTAKSPVDDGKRTLVFYVHIPFSNQVFGDQKRDAEDQEKKNKYGNQ